MGISYITVRYVYVLSCQLLFIIETYYALSICIISFNSHNTHPENEVFSFPLFFKAPMRHQENTLRLASSKQES